MNVSSDNAPKGRADLARPLVSVLCLGMLLLLATASAAHAALAVPILTDTNPVSPGASLTPRIMGEFEGSETKAVPFGIGLRAAGPVTKSLAEPDNTVRIYTSAGCAGPVAAEGTAEELAEGSGIQVDSAVAADLVTIFYATQSKPGETSGCSVQGLPYRQVTNPPAAPTFSSVAPASPANENFPRLIGTADPEASVSIFAGPSCADTALASGSGAQFGGAGIVVGVLDNSENTFSARAAIAGFTSSCSVTPIVYHEVTPVSPPGGGGGGGGESPGGGGGAPPATPSLPPPAPHLRTIPGGWANNNTPLLTGTAPGASTVRIFADPACAGTPVAKASFEQFTAGVPVQVIDNAATVFSAVAVNGSGRASSCSQPVIYVEDSLTPRTRITMGPAAKTAKRKAVFRFIDTTGNAPGTTFFCKVDKHRWKPCASPLRLGKLRPRAYVIQVKAIDPAGNAETKGAKRRFKVVSRP